MNASDLRNQIQDIRNDKRHVGSLTDAIKLVETSFPGEFWMVGHTEHPPPHYGSWKYSASVGGKAFEASIAGSDKPEKALTLAALALQLQRVVDGHDPR